MQIKRLDNRRGFTLVELMVVVAIIAFVTAAVIPSFSMSLQKNRQREAGLLVVKAMFAARSRAARLGRCQRVRIHTRAPGVAGGTGGMVAVDTSTQSSCTQAVNWGVWDQVSFFSVAGGTGPDGDDHAGLVGRDVAITAADGTVGADLTLHFEPSGGLWITDAITQRVRVQAYTSDGNQTGVARFVRINPAGSTFYGTE